jgi:hypothetical protein
MLCQGIIVGIGFGCLFTPGVSVIPQYFKERRHSASGIATLGSGFGGVVNPIILHRLAPHIGFDWAVRIVAFMALFFGILSTMLLRNRLPRRPMRTLVPPGYFRDVPILLYTMGIFFLFIALYIPAVYISSYALSHNIMSEDLAFYLVPILQAANVGGRLIPFLMADCMGPINMTVPALASAGIMSFAWIAIESEAGLLAFAVLYGVFFGIAQALGPACVASLTQDPTSIGSRSVCLSLVGVKGTEADRVLIGTLLWHRLGGPADRYTCGGSDARDEPQLLSIAGLHGKHVGDRNNSIYRLSGVEDWTRMEEDLRARSPLGQNRHSVAEYSDH